MEHLHNARIKFHIAEDAFVTIPVIFVVDDNKDIYEVKVEIMDLVGNSVKYSMKLNKKNIAYIDFPLTELKSDEAIVDIITSAFYSLRSNTELEPILDYKFFSANLKLSEIRRRIRIIETMFCEYPSLSVAYFRMLDGLLALLYIRNTIEMKSNITTFFLLQHEHKYKNPHSTILEYCLLELNRKIEK